MNSVLLRRNRNFRLLFSGAAAANLGDGIAALALPWLATMISRDPVHIALVAFATRLPWFVLSLPVGVLTDRADRQALMVWADLLRLILSFGIVGLIFAGPALPLSNDEAGVTQLILMISALAFALGAAEVVRDNAAQTCLPMLVDPDDLEQANGQIWSVEQIMGQFIGPPVAGLLIALAVPLPFSFNALAFGLAAFAVWSITFPARKLRAVPAGVWAEFLSGVRWILAHGTILQLAIMLGVMNALHMATLTILVLFSQEVLGLGAFGHGALLTMGAIGGVLGGLLCPALSKKLGQRRSLFLALAIMPTTFLLIYFADSVYIVGAALLVEMMAGVLWNVVTVSYRQRVIPEDILGRVNSIYRFFGWGMMPLGALAGGLIVTLLEPAAGREAALRAPFLIAGISMALIWLYSLMFLRLGKGS